MARRRGADIAGEAGETAVKEVLKLIADGVLEGIPFVGSAMRKLSGWTMRKVSEKVLRQTNATLKQAWPDGEPPEQLYRQEEMLPWILAQDLAAWIEAHPDDRLVLLVDEYESAFPEGLSGERRLTSPFDAAMRELAAQIKCILWVFFSRERLPWPEIDPDWTEYLHDRQHLLGGLEMADAEAFLNGVPVVETDLRQAMLMAARDEDGLTCYPLLLDLQVIPTADNPDSRLPGIPFFALI